MEEHPVLPHVLAAYEQVSDPAYGPDQARLAAWRAARDREFTEERGWKEVSRVFCPDSETGVAHGLWVRREDRDREFPPGRVLCGAPGGVIEYDEAWTLAEKQAQWGPSAVAVCPDCLRLLDP